MIRVYTPKQIKDYNVLLMDTKDIVVNKNDHTMYMKTNNVHTPTLVYKCAVKELYSIVPDNEIWYETIDGSMLKDSGDTIIDEQFIYPENTNATYLGQVAENGVIKMKYDAPITAITGNLINDSDLVTHIYLPNTLTTIGEEAFANLTMIQGNIVFPSSITTLGEKCLWGMAGTTPEGYKNPTMDLSYTHITTLTKQSLACVQNMSYIKFPPTLKYLAPLSLDMCAEVNGYDIKKAPQVVLDFSLLDAVPQSTIPSVNCLGIFPKSFLTIIVKDDAMKALFEASPLFTAVENTKIVTYAEYTYN